MNLDVSQTHQSKQYLNIFIISNSPLCSFHFCQRDWGVSQGFPWIHVWVPCPKNVEVPKVFRLYLLVIVDDFITCLFPTSFLLFLQSTLWKSNMCTGHFPFPNYKIYYPGAVWYSLPGPCPSENYTQWTDWCKEREPGGYCNQTPTGAGNCTWTYEDAGEITIDFWQKKMGITKDTSTWRRFVFGEWIWWVGKIGLMDSNKKIPFYTGFMFQRHGFRFVWLSVKFAPGWTDRHSKLHSFCGVWSERIHARTAVSSRINTAGVCHCKRTGKS